MAGTGRSSASTSLETTSVDVATGIGYEQTLWANCPRDIKLLAFNQLPELLDQIEKSLRHTAGAGGGG